MNNQAIFEVVNEHDIDYLILEEFWASKDFRKWFLTQIDCEKYDLVFVHAIHSYRYTAKNVNSKTNQTDIRADFLDSANHKYVFLIENKMGHDLAEKQVIGYQAVKEQISKEENAKIMTILLAPENEEYLSKKDGFDFFVCYESLLKFVESKALSEVRYEYKLKLLNYAIDKSRRNGRQKKGEEKPIIFRKKYCQIFNELAPKLNCPFIEDATSQSLFVNFKPDGFSDLKLKMRHKARPVHSNLDVEFSPKMYNLSQLEGYTQELAKYVGLPIDCVVARMASKSPALSIMVPGIDVNESWKEQERKVVFIAKLANKFYNWVIKNIG